MILLLHMLPNMATWFRLMGSIDTVRFITPHITKWYQFDPNDLFGYAMIKDFVLMRLGGTYLLLAESQFKQGKLDEAAASMMSCAKELFPIILFMARYTLLILTWILSWILAE
jgi:hypothetical protein